MFTPDYRGSMEFKDAMFLRCNRNCFTSPQVLEALLATAAVERLHIFRSQDNKPYGYAAIALISKYTLLNLVNQPSTNLKIYEYSEGQIAFIEDALLINRSIFNLRSLIRQRIGRRRLICYRHRDEVKIYYAGNNHVRLIRLRS